MKKINVIIKNIKKYNNNNFFKAKFLYTNMYESMEIDENAILFESFVGNSFTGNPFYLLKEICNNKKYNKYTKYVAINDIKKEELVSLLTNYQLMNKVKIIIRHSKEYCKILATAKYLINNVTFPTYFIRKDEQIYLNTWHGTPLKGLGRNVKDKPNSIGNVQRNFIQATHLLFPNDFTFDIIRNDYMLNNIYSGKYIKTGYPRNDILFDADRRENLKKKFGWENKNIIIYMPTWRDSKSPEQKNDKQLHYIVHALYELEKKLPENTIMLVKLHHLANKFIDFSCFKKIQQFPEGYETYEILNLSDKLITDYSSVMFDFLNKKKDIILYTYDEEEYCAGRSLYMPIRSLPFEFSDNIVDLCNKISEKLKLNDEYLAAKEKFCKYDSNESAKKICEYIFEGKIASDKFEVIDAKKFNNKKKNILIFSGALLKNGITSALRALLNNIDLNENNYFLAFYNKATSKNIDFINALDKRVCYMPIMGPKNFKKYEAVFYHLYFRWNLNTKLANEVIKRIYKREKKRLYKNINFDTVIHYTGYECQIIHLLSTFESANKIIYTHSDLYKERKLRNNIHINSLKYAYKTFDKIAIIREGMEEEIIKNIRNVDKSKIKLAHNLNDIEYVKEKANKEITFDKDTESTVSLQKLQEILNTDSIKFINVARFSPEKGLNILIEAFNQYSKQDPNAYLIIVGGHGKEYEEIKEMAVSTNKNIIIIKSLSNPYAILNKTDCFVLSSLYEGLPMTIMEALILDKKIISTNIEGPKKFLSQGYGHLVEGTPEGICNGMLKYKKDKLKELKKFDPNKFNENALLEFYKLIKK